MPDYRIYATLLDGFQDLLDSELIWDEHWGKIEDPKMTPAEFEIEKEVGLINSINRVPFTAEAASKGTAFNEIIDCLIEFRGSSREDCKIHSSVIPVDDTPRSCIIAEIDNFSFIFDTQFCREFADGIVGSLPQFRCEHTMSTEFGEVELYGFIDEMLPRRVVDIKTTGNYSWGKFERKWQRHLYPWALTESGMAKDIDEFEYRVVVFPKDANPPIKGSVYSEVYSYNHAKSAVLLKSHVEHFIHWLESRRELITDRRIFGGENPEDYKPEKLTPSKFKKWLNSKESYSTKPPREAKSVRKARSIKSA